MLFASVLPNVTPLGIASLTISTVVAPVVAWLTRNGVKLLKRYNVLSTKVAAMRTEIDSVKSSALNQDQRLIRVEEALVEIKQTYLRSEASLASINTKLDALPRLDTTLQAQSALLAKVVPREEIDQRLAQHDHRIGLVEQDVRKA